MFRNGKQALARDISSTQNILKEGNYVFAGFGSAERYEQQRIETREFGECGQVFSLLVISIAWPIRLVQSAPRLFAGFFQIPIEFTAGFTGVDLRGVQSFPGIASQLVGRLARFRPGVVFVPLRAARQRESEKKQGQRFHQPGYCNSNANYVRVIIWDRPDWGARHSHADG
jgi:hypothetical protein